VDGAIPDALGEPLVGDPGVGGEQLQHRAIDLVDVRLLMIRHGGTHPISN